MCFSATASFFSGAVIGGIGFFSVKKKVSTEMNLLSAIPILFSIQQFLEGFVWLSFDHPEYLFIQSFAAKGFLLFATVVWPIWVPMSVLLIEKEKFKKQLTALFLLFGVVFAITAAWQLFGDKVVVSAENSHIYYKIDYPVNWRWLSAIFYLLATVSPLLISSKRSIVFLGIMIFLSYLITRLYYKDFLISVWCFFAALISAIVYLIVTESFSTLFKNKK